MLLCVLTCVFQVSEMQSQTDSLVAQVPKVIANGSNPIQSTDYVALSQLVAQLVDIARELSATQDAPRKRHMIGKERKKRERER